MEIGIFALCVAYEAGKSVRIDVQVQTPQVQSFEALRGKLSTENNIGFHRIHANSRYPSFISPPFFEE